RHLGDARLAVRVILSITEVARLVHHEAGSISVTPCPGRDPRRPNFSRPPLVLLLGVRREFAERGAICSETAGSGLRRWRFWAALCSPFLRSCQPGPASPGRIWPASNSARRGHRPRNCWAVGPAPSPPTGAPGAACGFSDRRREAPVRCGAATTRR